MSMYIDIYNDLPIRCWKLWKLAKDSAKKNDREVTLMIMVATTGLANPWEHLKVPVNKGHPSFQEFEEKDHPAIKGIQKPEYLKALEIVKNAMTPNLAFSRLFSGASIGKWHFCEVEKMKEIRDAVEYNRLPNQIEKLNTQTVIRVLRNALAHNNLYVFGGISQEIGNLVFFSEQREKERPGEVIGYDVLSIPVIEFELFLENWFAMLEEAAPKSAAASGLRLVQSQVFGDEIEQIAA